MNKFKIIFCIILVISVAIGAFGVKLGSNKLNATIETVKNSDFLPQIYLDNSLFDEMASGFGYDWLEFRAEILDNYENSYSQRLKISVTNENDFDIKILGLEVKEGQGADGILISTTPEKCVVVPANCTEPVAVWFRVITDGEDMDETIVTVKEDMSMKIIYTDAKNDVDRLSDASKGILKSEWIR